jgi:hypothetical protein
MERRKAEVARRLGGGGRTSPTPKAAPMSSPRRAEMPHEQRTPSSTARRASAPMAAGAITSRQISSSTNTDAATRPMQKQHPSYWEALKSPAKRPQSPRDARVSDNNRSRIREARASSAMELRADPSWGSSESAGMEAYARWTAMAIAEGLDDTGGGDHDEYIARHKWHDDLAKAGHWEDPRPSSRIPEARPFEFLD